MKQTHIEPSSLTVCLQSVLTVQLLESMKRDDAISAFFQQLSTRYPELPSPLIHERDMYLAWSLKRSKAVNGARAVVGVVGRGHLRGIVFALTTHDAGTTLTAVLRSCGGEE